MDFRPEVDPLEIDLNEKLLDNSEPTFTLNTMETGDPLDWDIPVERPELKLTEQEQILRVVEYLSHNTAMVTSLNQSITESKLDVMSDNIGFDVYEAYLESQTFNTFLNAIAQGFIVGNHFEKIIRNADKIYFVVPSQSDSIHLRELKEGLVYKTYPAITSFDLEAINAASALYENYRKDFTSAYDRLVGVCYCPSLNKTDEDQSYILAYDNLTLAKTLANSKKSLTAGIQKLKKVGMDSERLNKVMALAKAVKEAG